MKSPTLFRPLFFTLLMLLAVTLSAQRSENDYREEIHGKFHVAPDGTVWSATQNSIIHKLAPGDSLWRSHRFYIDGSTAINWPDGWNDGNQMFFLGDSTILLFNTNRDETVNYYRSTDNGKTWVQHSFPNPDEKFVECVYARNGRIWLTQSCGSLFFSDDNGLNFKSVPSAVVIPRHCFDMNRISMLSDGRHGVTSGRHSHIFLTDDNWQTATKLKSPFDLGLLPNDPDYSDTHINDLLYWRNFLLIEQNGCCFYTEVGDTARWRALPVATESFMEDTARNLLAITTKDGYLLLTADLRQFDTIGRFSDTDGGTLIAVRDNQYYVTNKSHLFIVSRDGVRTHDFYTDQPIHISEYRSKDKVGSNLFYIEGRSRRSLYHFDKKRNQWYRIKTPLKTIADILPYQKSRDVVMLSDGYHNYLFDINKQTYTPFRYEHPLQDFLKHPIKSILITASSFGCFHSIIEGIEYSRNGDFFVSQDNKLREEWNAEDSIADKCFKEFSKTFPAAKLDSLLNNLDEHYDMGLSWKMFDITPSDIDSMRATIKLMDNRIRNDKASLQWAGDTMLQLSDSLLTAIVLPDYSGGCTTSNKLAICFTNSQNKKLVIRCEDSNCQIGSVPYMLPGRIDYDGKIFYVSHIPFMQFVSTLMPEKMITRNKFTVHELLCKVARYLLEW